MNTKIYIKEISDLLKTQKTSFCYFLKFGIFQELNKFSFLEFKINSKYKNSKKKLFLEYKLNKIYNNNKTNTTQNYKIIIKVNFFFKKKQYLGTKILCEIPLMLPNGNFFINGCERTIIYQIRRNPGVYFTKLDNLDSKIATIIPIQGPWLSIEFDKKGYFWFKTPNTNLTSFIDFFQLKEKNTKIKYKIKSPLLFYLKYFEKNSLVINNKNNENNLQIKTIINNSKYFILDKFGRLNLNKKLELKSKLLILTIEDIIKVMEILTKTKSFDNIDSLENRHITTISFLMQNCLFTGLLRFKSHINYLFNINSKFKNWFGKNIKTRKKIENSNIEVYLKKSSPIVTTFIEFFNTSNLSQYVDQTNDLSEIIHQRRITCLGPKGLKKTNITLNLRDIQSTFFNRICPIETAEGKNVGIIMSLSSDVILNKFGILKASYLKINKNKIFSNIKFLNSKEEKNFNILFENNYIDKNNYIKKQNYIVKKKESFLTVNSSQLNYIIKSPFQIFSPSLLLIPFLEHNDATRTLMGANMYRQTVPILFGEKPIVNSGFEIEIGSFCKTIILSYNKGIVEKIFYNKIIIRDIYNRKIIYNLKKFQMSNQRTLLHQYSRVWIGQKINYGQILVNSSSTNNGELSLGRNLNVAYMSWEGYNFEDAIIISDRLVKENLFSSIHFELTTVNLEKNDDFILYKENKFDKKILYSSDLLLTTTPYTLNEIIETDKIYLVKKNKINFINLLENKKNINSNLSNQNIIIKTFKNIKGKIFDIRIIKKKDKSIIFQIIFGEIIPLQIGDKLSGRHGNKGVISKIVPKNEMPFLLDGNTIDIILNPLGIPSRMNIGQIFECLLGFIGNKLHKNFKIFSFDETYNKNASQLLINQNFIDLTKIKNQNTFYNFFSLGKQILRDGKTGKLYENPILVGKSYILKLIHIVEKKLHSRNIGTYQQLTQQPPRGKSLSGGQRFGEMEVWALEAHGTTYTLKEFLTIKSDNYEVRKFLYNSIKNNKKFPGIKIPEIFKVLIKHLNALGLSINIYGFDFISFNVKKLNIEEESFNINNKMGIVNKNDKKMFFHYSTL